MASEFHPHAYQRYFIQRIIDTPCLGGFLDMGLGKTVCVLTALHELKYMRWSIRKALVIAPKKVAETTWTTEAVKWEHLRDLRVVTVLGSERQRLAALEQIADVYVINRENTQWLVKHYGHAWPFDVVVLDESSSFKSHRAERFKALKCVRPRIGRLIELTGTPRPKSLMDLWAQIYLLDGGKRLGRTISTYREMYFTPGRRNRTTIFEYDPKPGADEAIHNAISDICISMKAADYLELPDLVIHDIPVLLDSKARRAYDRLERDMLLDVDGDTITAATAAALSNKLLQCCNGAVYGENGEVIHVHDCKIDAFLETIERLHGQPVIVYYHYKHDLTRLLEALRKYDPTLRVRVYADGRDKDAWNAGEIDVLLAQPASCAYGLNLQEGGHNVIWFAQTWNLEEYVQANKRIHRQGQPYPVFVHRLIVQGGRDVDAIRSLECKDGGQEAFLESLKVRINKVKEGAQ